MGGILAVLWTQKVESQRRVAALKVENERLEGENEELQEYADMLHVVAEDALEARESLKEEVEETRRQQWGGGSAGGGDG